MVLLKYAVGLSKCDPNGNIFAKDDLNPLKNNKLIQFLTYNITLLQYENPISQSLIIFLILHNLVDILPKR